MASDSAPPEGSDAGPPPEASDATEDSQQPAITFVTQYVKDLSFENPGAPGTIVKPEDHSRGNVTFHVKRRRLSGDDHEVVLEFNLEAQQPDGSIAFIIELVYAGVFTVRGLGAEARQLALSVECPKILFPFARRIIADAARDGGYPPVMLGPIDFATLYREQRAAEAAQPPAEAAPEPAGAAPEAADAAAKPSAAAAKPTDT
jgi:preprotein translocase subunit SecB